MATKREQILQALNTTLQTITGVSVHRSRVEPFTRAKSPAIVIEPIQDSADSAFVPVLEWTLQVRIMVIVRGDVPDSESDPYVKSIHDKICLDRELGGLCIDISPSSVSYEMIEGDKPVGLVSCIYIVRYRTSDNDLTI